MQDIYHKIHPSAGSRGLVVKMAKTIFAMLLISSTYADPFSGGGGHWAGIFKCYLSSPWERPGGWLGRLFFACLCVRSVWVGLLCCESGGVCMCYYKRDHGTPSGLSAYFFSASSLPYADAIRCAAVRPFLSLSLVECD
jgi:hypothetical protein